MCVEAGAGTGKTTGFIEYARARPESKMLYLCFNNKASKEAEEKYKSQNITNTRTSTIHGLASQTKKRYENANKFSTRVSIKDIEKRFGYSTKLSWLILETIKNYCYSSDREISIHHMPTLIDKESKAASILIKESQGVWNRMVSLQDTSPISYDHYLKIFQLSSPKLDYDYILLDEAQDSNPLTLSILEDQRKNTRTILIGDENQAIYSWRGAKNAMKQWSAEKRLKLTESFRFGDSIASLANTVLKTYPGNNPRIKGSQKPDGIYFKPQTTSQGTTFIARTNATLFEKAVELQNIGLKCHFINTEATDDWDPTTPYKLNDLKDIYRLWIGHHNSIESPLIKIFKNYGELRAIAIGDKDKNKRIFLGDKELEFLCRMVEKYKHGLPDIVQTIKDQASGPPKAPGDRIVTLCSAHRAKGLEWETVELADDFVEIDKMTGSIAETLNPPETGNLEFEDPEYQSYIEEINLLYVACTRARSNLYVNKDLSQVCLKGGIKISEREITQEQTQRSNQQPKETQKSSPNISVSNQTLYLTM